MSNSEPVPRSADTNLAQLVLWLQAKYRRHGEMEDKHAAESLEYAIARLTAIDAWLDSPHPNGGVWLDHIDDSFMNAWEQADAWLKRGPLEY